MELTRSSNEGSTNNMKLVTENDGQMAIEELVGLRDDGTLELKMRSRVAVVIMKDRQRMYTTNSVSTRWFHNGKQSSVATYTQRKACLQ